MRAAADLPSAAGDDGVDWSALPQPSNVPANVRAMIQRDAAANLPALASRQLFDDSEHAPAEATTTVPPPAPSLGPKDKDRLVTNFIEAVK